MRRIGIFGAGGMARDALHTLDALGVTGRIAAFYEDDTYWRERCIHGIPVLPAGRIADSAMDMVIALGNGSARDAVVARMPPTVAYPVFVHPSVQIGRAVELGEGTFVCAGSILTTDIVIGRHVQLNIGSTVTHDCRLDDFVTTGPGARLSGNCHIGRHTYLGTGSVLREGTSVPAGSTIGMGSVVVGSISEQGTYVGNPARRIR